MDAASVRQSAAAAVAVGSADGCGVGVGAAVGSGVGVGDGVGVGGGGPVTVTCGPGSGAGGSALTALKVTSQVPAGSVAVPCQVPSLALPLTLTRATMTLPTCAETDWAGCAGLPVEA